MLKNQRFKPRTSWRNPLHLAGSPGYPKHLPSTQDDQPAWTWVGNVGKPSTIAMLRALPCGTSSCFPCGLWLAVVANIHPQCFNCWIHHPSRSLIQSTSWWSPNGLDSHLSIYTFSCWLSRCCFSIHVVRKTFWMHIFQILSPVFCCHCWQRTYIDSHETEDCTTCSCKIIVSHWWQLMFAACTHKLLVASSVFGVVMSVLLPFFFDYLPTIVSTSFFWWLQNHVCWSGFRESPQQPRYSTHHPAKIIGIEVQKS